MHLLRKQLRRVFLHAEGFFFICFRLSRCWVIKRTPQSVRPRPLRKPERPGIHAGFKVWPMSDCGGFERYFVQLEPWSKFPPGPDKDEVAVWEDTVAFSQVGEKLNPDIRVQQLTNLGWTTLPTLPKTPHANWNIMRILYQLKPRIVIHLRKPGETATYACQRHGEGSIAVAGESHLNVLLLIHMTDVSNK